MHRHHRRLTPTSRTYRHTRVPAYKVRRPPRLVDPTEPQPAEPAGPAPEHEPIAHHSVSNGQSQAQDNPPVPAEPAIIIAHSTDEPDARTESYVPTSAHDGGAGAAPQVDGAADAGAPPGTPPPAAEYQLTTDIPVAEEIIGPVLPGHDGQQLVAPPPPTVPADPAAPPPNSVDYADYLQSIEAAAARSRAELRGRAVPRMRPQAAATVPLTPASPLSGSGGGAAGAPPWDAPAEMPEGDTPRRVRSRRRKWLLVAAILPVTVSIGLLIYAANLAKTTFDAYNDIHVEATPRERFTINPQGTPEVVPTEEVAQILPDWDKKDKVNILLLGIDPRPDDEEPPRSDTIIVVNIDPEAEVVTMMSIPRDVWVYIPGFREDKINAAYPLGEANAASVPGGGPTLVAQTIEANFGIPIHYFATVDFDGFRKIVDTIGGVFIDVPAPVKDDQYPTEDYGLTRVYFPTGLQKMDGETALRYARTRHGDNDVARGDRQQQVLRAIRAQATTLGLITRATELISEIGDAVRTDLNFNQMLALANLGRNISGENIQSINLWELGLLYEHDPEYEGDAFYFEADWQGVHALMAQYFAITPEPTPTPEATATMTPGPTETATEEATSTSEATATDETTATTSEATATLPGQPVPGPGVNLALPVVVQNSSGIDLLATDSVALLSAAGFTELYVDSTDVTLPTTVIYDNVGSPDTALYVAGLLGLPPSVIQPSNGGTALLVVLGEDVPLDVLRP
ncbi:MAG: hypothetical protein DCC58_10115 [Chloroflexi bacterium]|nr:MAG: hypothetical protein DCC58_10115 [Chloroflexota bacterium]